MSNAIYVPYSTRINFTEKRFFFHKKLFLISAFASFEPRKRERGKFYENKL